MKLAFRKLLIGSAAIAATTLMSLPSAQALDVGASLGGASVGASVGGGDNGGLGASASASVGGDSGVSAGVSAGIGGGGGVNAGVNASVGGSGGVGANVGVSLGGGGSGTGGGSGIGDGVEGVATAYNGMSRAEQVRIRKTCRRVLGNRGGFDSDLVMLCRLLKQVR